MLRRHINKVASVARQKPPIDSYSNRFHKKLFCWRQASDTSSTKTGVIKSCDNQFLSTRIQHSDPNNSHFEYHLCYLQLIWIVIMGACGSSAAAASNSSNSQKSFERLEESLLENAGHPLSKRVFGDEDTHKDNNPGPTARTSTETMKTSDSSKERRSNSSASNESMASLGSTGSCTCEPGKQPPPPSLLKKKSGQILKRATLRRMEEGSSKENLEDKYKVQWNKVLGEGAFGSVYLATNFKTGEKVALKKISKKFTDQREFQREMDALLHLQNRGGHPNICGLHEHFDEGNCYYLVLDLIRGGEMFDHLIQMGAYSEADAARLLREVASALAFCHGIGIVHGDLKPENIMLSTSNASDAVVKLVDFGGSEVLQNSSLPLKTADERGRTPAYCPPEILKSPTVPMSPAMDMWSLGIIMYIMLTGLHPFDLSGRTPDDEVEKRIVNKIPPPLRNSAITAHLSDSALELIERLMAWAPNDRMTAMQMLNHEWIKGETATTTKIADSDKKLSTYRRFQSSLERKVFEDIVSWSDDSPEEVLRKTSLVERAFRSLDPQCKGYLTTSDLKRVSSGHHLNAMLEDEETPGGDSALSLSGFSDLLSENMKNKYYEAGRVLYREGEYGNHMYFINSGTIEVTTKDGAVARRSQGDFFGEGALLHPKKIRSATITCVTPVHAIEISREYFEKYLATSERGLALNLREKDRARKRNRAKTILRLQNHLTRQTYNKGDFLFNVGEEGDALYIIETGTVTVCLDDHVVFTVTDGDVCGEHSLILGRPRNTKAVCVSDSCVALVMKARDFYSLYDSSSHMRDSLRELCMRREFQKAIVRKAKRPFPTTNELREVFDAADEDRDGVINAEELTKLLVSFDHTLSENELRDILMSMDLTKNGIITFEAFDHMFGMKPQHRNLHGC